MFGLNVFTYFYKTLILESNTVLKFVWKIDYDGGNTIK